MKSFLGTSTVLTVNGEVVRFERVNTPLKGNNYHILPSSSITQLFARNSLNWIKCCLINNRKESNDKDEDVMPSLSTTAYESESEEACADCQMSNVHKKAVKKSTTEQEAKLFG